MASRTVNIKCPSCGHETEQPVSTARMQTELTCPHCGAPIRIDRNELLRDLEEVDEAFEDLFGSTDDKDP